MSGITWLHISDLHFRESEAFNSSIVVRSLLWDLSRRVEFAPESEKIDLIFITGDIAFSGNSREYFLAQEFLDKLRQVTHVDKSRIFIIPGNHDVDRGFISAEARSMLTELRTREAVNELMGNSLNRATIMERLRNYGEFTRNYFGKRLMFNSDQYFYVKKRTISGRQIAIIGLNSAWSCGSDGDRLNLFLGERQVRSVIESSKTSDIRIALVHHPFDWLHDFDRGVCEALLLQNCHFILRGHLHETSLIHQQAPNIDSIVIAAGACYESRYYPNSYNLVHFDTPNTNIYLRSYSDKDGGFWTLDSTTYRDVQGKYTFKTNSLSPTVIRKIGSWEEDTMNKWWKERGYRSDPFSFDNAEDVHSEKLLEMFQWWYVDPEMPADSKGLGIPHFLNKVKSVTTSDPVLIYIPKGGGKTFYRKWASAQIDAYESSGLSIEIADLAEQINSIEKVTTLDLAGHIQRIVSEKLNLTESSEQPSTSGSILAKLNSDVKQYLISNKEVERIFLFIDGLEQLFDEQSEEQNHRALQALAEMCKLFADQNNKALALRLLTPLELEKPLRRTLGNKYTLKIRHYSIDWDIEHCESILEARLNSYLENGPNSLLGGHLERLLSQDAITEFRRGLHGVQVSPRCVIRLFRDLGDYAYTRGITWDQFIDSKIMIDFMKNNANVLCSAVNYPFWI